MSSIILQKIIAGRNHAVIIVFLSLLSVCPSLLYAQQVKELTPRSVFSLIVCSPSSDYEGGIGHSALRLQDDSLRIDVVFNFGSYSENQSFFFYKVLLGTLTSSLEGEHFHKFADRYKKEGRGMNECYLNLDLEQRQTLWAHLNYLLINSERFYKFNVPFNNCTTQIRDELFNQLGWDKNYFYGVSSGMTYREVVQTVALENPWQNLLMHIIIGTRVDNRNVSLYEAACVPEELVTLLSNVYLNGKPLIWERHEIFPPQQIKKSPLHIITITSFGLLLICIVFLTWMQTRKRINSLIWMDRLFLLFTGLTGCFMLSLCLFSEISLLNYNFNLLWALPTNVILCVMLKNKPNGLWTKRLLQFTYSCLVLFPVLTLLVPQHTPVESYFLAGSIFVRVHYYLFMNKG